MWLVRRLALDQVNKHAISFMNFNITIFHSVKFNLKRFSEIIKQVLMTFIPKSDRDILPELWMPDVNILTCTHGVATSEYIIHLHATPALAWVALAIPVTFRKKDHQHFTLYIYS